MMVSDFLNDKIGQFKGIFIDYLKTHKKLTITFLLHEP